MAAVAVVAVVVTAVVVAVAALVAVVVLKGVAARAESRVVKIWAVRKNLLHLSSADSNRK